MLRTILLIVLVLAILGSLPTWPYRTGWGYYPTGGLGYTVADSHSFRGYGQALNSIKLDPGQTVIEGKSGGAVGGLISGCHLPNISAAMTGVVPSDVITGQGPADFGKN